MTSTDGNTVLRWAGLSDVGKVRDGNEDQFLLRPEAQLWAVADGMGGHRGGEVASQLACDEISRHYQQPTVDGLVEAIAVANRSIHEVGLRDPELRGMGTTVVALAVVEGDEVDRATGTGPNGEVLAIANVGDSRAYRLSGGELEQLTEDHSLVNDLVKEGSISPEEAESHPQKNILTRVLGVYDEIPIDIITLPPRAGDRYLLCSDGLFNEVSESDIAVVLRQVEDPQRAAAELVRLSLDHGARDNTTVVLVDIVNGDAASPDIGNAGVTVPTAEVPAMERTQPTAQQQDAVGPDTAAMPTPYPSEATDPLGPATAPVAVATPPDTDRDPSAQTTARQGGAYSDPDEPEVRPRRPRRSRSRPEATAGDLTDDADDEDIDVEAKHGRLKPRRFTWRVALFIILLLAVFGGAIATVQWYGRSGYFVAFNDADDVIIYRGRPGGIAWVQPEAVETTSLDRETVPADQVLPLESGREYSSLSDAQEFVSRLEARSEDLSTPDSEPGSGSGNTGDGNRSDGGDQRTDGGNNSGSNTSTSLPQQGEQGDADSTP